MKRFAVCLLGLYAMFYTHYAQAQYYEIANQLQNLISPALSGAFNYKGYVELGGSAGLGHNRANFVGVSTSQGFRYSTWFFMGAGIGVDVAMAHRDAASGYDYGRGSSETRVMVPVFTDFRFNIGDLTEKSFFIDMKIGAAWLLGSDYLCMESACLTNSSQFYLKPSLGLRIPVGDTNKRAINIGIAYQLVTSGNNYNGYSNTLALNNVGVTLGFEW